MSVPTGLIAHRHWHRGVFAAAAVYNVGWGLITVFKPGWFFEFAGMEAPRYPEIFACLGMVIGLYGVLYAAVAWEPERGWLIAAVGLAGKVLGPMGMLMAIRQGDWPAKALWLCVAIDFIWRAPFGWYFFDCRQLLSRAEASRLADDGAS